MRAPAIHARSKFFKFERSGDAYSGEENELAEPRPVYAGDVAFVDVSGDLTRRLGRRNIPVVLFTVGARKGWFWMPRDEFYNLAKEHDIREQTSTPFQP